MDRRMERPGETKPFTMGENQMLGATNKEKLADDEKYTEVAIKHRQCLLHANAYAMTMLYRIEEEKPEIYEEKGMNRSELAAHLANNLCLGQSKQHAVAMREHVANRNANDTLKDDIRRLYNGGHRYHPYL